jgi:hypothetical protein
LKGSVGTTSRLLPKATEVSVPPTAHPANPTLEIVQIAVFSALVAVGTILSNVLFGFVLPPPLSEITAAPAFYLAIAVLYPRKVSFWSIAIGSGIGETANIFLFGEAAAIFAISYVPGIILARAPEALIVNKFRQRETVPLPRYFSHASFWKRLRSSLTSLNWLVLGMVIATIYETLAFFFIDWPIYSLTIFYCTQAPCGDPVGITQGFFLAAFDFATLIDLAWIPVALALVVAVRRAFKIRFFG